MFILGLLLSSGCSNQNPTQKKVTFVVKNLKPQPDDKIFITGDNYKLGDWDPGEIILEKVNDSTWTKTISFNQGEKIEFKITGGSWPTEVLNSKHLVYDNFVLKVEKDTIFRINVYGLLNQYKNGKLFLNAERFHPDKPYTVINRDWLYHSGDNTEWAREDYNDSGWTKTDSYMYWEKNKDSKWKNIGWFRYHLWVDSTLWNRTLAISIGHLGASQIYYNGRLLYSFGKIGKSYKSIIPKQNRLWKEIKIDPKNDQLLAVRYANYDWKRHKDLGFAPGFAIYLKDINSVFEAVQEFSRSATIQQMVFTSIPLILFMLHIFLYAFYRKQNQNLFYAISLLGFAGLTYFNYQKYIETDPGLIILYYQLNTVMFNVAVFFGLLTAYSMRSDKLPKRWIIFLIISSIIMFLRILFPVAAVMGYISYGFLIIVMIDIGILFRKGSEKAQKGLWMIGVGFVLLGLFVIWQILIDYSIVSSFLNINQIWVFGMLSFAIAMSVFLSYNFSLINRNLELQIIKVKELSEKAIQQEKIAAKLELERKLIDIEHEKKSKELESARELQLSLLPKSIPKINNLDISCYMTTATEVGGDYYDFFISDDNVLTTVIGDATGHGLKAGNMVIVTKGLLNILSAKNDLVDILNNANHAIKKMNLSLLNMGLSILRLNRDKLVFSSAGMPPLLIYKRNSNTVEQFILKTMPLGAFYNFPYQKTETVVSRGDVILLCSDGLTELFNSKKEIFGFERVQELLVESADGTAEEIINFIIDRSKKWIGDYPLEDDLTAVIIKISG
jgi:serine phosphatase RsbU (regulator of sigma subunit)